MRGENSTQGHIRPRTRGADKGCDTRQFVSDLRDRGITPHVAENPTRQGGSAIDGPATRHAGYAISQRLRKRVEEIFAWSETVGGMRRSRFKGRERMQLFPMIVGTACNVMGWQESSENRRQHGKSAESAAPGADEISIRTAACGSSDRRGGGIRLVMPELPADAMNSADSSATC